MLDLDGFKEINDKYGHQEGDAVLKKMARILSGAFRSDDFIARFGGDEFIVFLDHIPNCECASFRAEEVRRQVYAPVSYTHLDVYKRQTQWRGAVYLGS